LGGESETEVGDPHRLVRDLHAAAKPQYDALRRSAHVSWQLGGVARVADLDLHRAKSKVDPAESEDAAARLDDVPVDAATDEDRNASLEAENPCGTTVGSILPVFALFGPDRHQQDEPVAESYDAWVVGCHRIGHKVVDALRKMDKSHIVIDFDPEVIKRLKHEEVPHLFGDIADVEFLEGLPLASAKLIVMTIPAVDDQVNMIRFVRSNIGEHVPIVANAYHQPDSDELYEAGANLVMMPHMLGGHWIANALTRESWDMQSFVKLKQELQEQLS